MTDATCIAPGCEAAVAIKKRSLCRPHYNRFNVYGDLNLTPPNKTCLWCDGPVERTGDFGPYPSYCSKTCRSRASYDRRREEVSRKLREENARIRAATVKNCRHCDNEFTPTNSLGQGFCSDSCRRRWYKVNNPNPCSEDGCEDPHLARGLCTRHYKRQARAEGRLANDPWSDRRRANYHKRRALKRKLPADDIRPMEVYERDGWICQICFEPVDQKVKWPDPMSPSLDHVIPLSKGGHHVWENTALAHLDCNVRKGDRVSVD